MEISGTVVDGDEGLEYVLSWQTNLVIVLHELTVLFCNVFRKSYHLSLHVLLLKSSMS